MTGEWQVATRKGGSKRAQMPVQPLPFTTDLEYLSSGPTWSAFHPERTKARSSSAGSHGTDDALARLQQQIELRSRDLHDSTFLHSFLRLWTYVNKQYLLESSTEPCAAQDTFRWEFATELIIYGLGSPSTGTRAVHCQLAFALLVQRKLPQLKQTCAYDPVFNMLDKDLLSSYQVKVLEQNDSGQHTVKGLTLFYMPHCDCHLYNNLLKANWGPQQMSKIAILGNSFHSYAQRWSQSSTRDHANRPRELLAVSLSGTAVELPVSEADFPVPSAFNDLSLHLFPEWKVSHHESALPSTQAAEIGC